MQTLLFNSDFLSFTAKIDSGLRGSCICETPLYKVQHNCLPTYKQLQLYIAHCDQVKQPIVYSYTNTFNLRVF